MSEIVQIILGTNGSGKTSLVRDISVLPGIKDNYGAGGHKKVIVRHNGDSYRLESHFNKGQEHLFFKNDIEDLNPGRTLTVQKEMVKKVFGVTQDIHDLLVGDELFTNMAFSRRREWLTRLCDTDFTYAIGVFKKASEKHRDVVGSLRTTRERLASETSKRLSDQTIADIRRRLTELTVESQKLYALKNTDIRNTSELATRINEHSSMVHQIDARFRKLRKEISNDAVWSIDELTEELAYAMQDLAAVESNYTMVSGDFMEATDKLSSVQSAQGFSIPQLVDDIDALKKRKEVLIEQGCRFVKYDDPLATHAALEENYETLVRIFSALPPDPNKENNRENYENTKQLVESIQRNINQGTVELEKLNHKQEHYQTLKDTGGVVCPSCLFSWIRDYDEAAHLRVTGQISSLQNKLTEAKKTLTVKQQLLKDIGDYVRLLDPYIQLSRHNRPLRALCEYLAENGMITTSPRSALTLIESERLGLNKLLVLPEIDQSIQEKINALHIAKKSKDDNADLLKKQLSDLENRLGFLVNQKSTLLRNKEKIEENIRRCKMFSDIEESLTKNAASLEALMREWFDAKRNDLIDQILVDTHSNIAMLRNHLNEIESREAVLADLRAQIEELEISEKALKEVTNALSPVDGLIAEGMLGFIRHYVDAMNAIIEKVWSYQLIVKDCSLEEDTAELNYKFPMQVGNQVDPVPDVRLGSSGMTDIVNLAFKVVAMYKSGLSGYPLVLDEFGKAFDEEHREASVRAIKGIIDSLGFSQIFMISHYESCWGAFDNAQVCVIDKRNITLPAGLVYNKHIQMLAS